MNSGALTAPVSQSFTMPTSTIWKENGTSIFARGKSEPAQANATNSHRIIVSLAKAIALAPVVATGAVTMMGTPYSQLETASTAPEYVGQVQASIVAQHLFSISIQSRMTQTIDGLATALHKLVWELSAIIVKFDSLDPGLQLTEDKSLILALGSKASDSVMVEFFYDADTFAFENEASFIGRKAGKLTAEVIAKCDASTKISEFLA